MQEIIEKVKSERATWDALFKQIEQERLIQPGFAGRWSVKDIIAHITWHEKEITGLVKVHALVGSDLWNLLTNERNAAIYEEVHQQPLEQVLEESTQVYQQLIDMLPSLIDQDLTNPESFPGFPPDWQSWMIIAQNAYKHYQYHILDLEKWIVEKN